MRHLAAIISSPKLRELHDHFPRIDRALDTELNNITLGLNQLKDALVADHSYYQMSESLDNIYFFTLQRFGPSTSLNFKSLDVILAVQVISSL